jgi:hypothetical protein
LARAALATALVPAIGAAGLAACSKSGQNEEAAADAGPAVAVVDAGGASDAGLDAPRDTRAEDERAGWIDAGRFCGDGKLQPDCPMQAWMKKNATAMLGFGDISAIADVFDRIARLAPDDVTPEGRPVYGNWKSISEDGAAAARAGDVPAAKAACRGCHIQYLRRYQVDLRGKPVPGTP